MDAHGSGSGGEDVCLIQQYVSVFQQLKIRTPLLAHTQTAPDNPKAEELYAKSFAVIQDVFGNEDFAASETCQRGLETGAIPDVIYCGMEEAIPRFYEGIEAVMAGDQREAAE